MAMASSSFLSTIKPLPSPHGFLSCHPKNLSDHVSPKAFIIRNGPMPLKEDKSSTSDSSSSSSTTTNQIHPPSPFFITELSIPILSPIPHQILPSVQSNGNEGEDLGDGLDGALSDKNSDVSALGAPQNGFVGDMESCTEQGLRCAWPRVYKRSPIEIKLGPRCPWPRSKANNGLHYVQQQHFPRVKDGPKCSWPRTSIISHHEDNSYVSTLETSNQISTDQVPPNSEKKFEEMQSSTLFQGPRCPWPRAIISSSSIGLSNHVFATSIGLGFINYLILGAPEVVMS